MFLIIKDMSGCDFRLQNKTISFKGGCFLNEVSNEDFNEIKKLYPSFVKAIDEGFIIVNSNENKKEVEKAVNETLQKTLNKQNEKIKANERNNKVKVTKE